MSDDTRATPQLDNGRYLATAMRSLSSLLIAHADRARGGSGAPAAGRRHQAVMAAAARTLAELPLERIVVGFGLSPFERDILLLCAAVELDAAFGPLCAAAQGDPTATAPTFGLALAALPAPHWSALMPDGQLRRWRLVEVGPGNSLVASPLRADERVLHEIAGAGQLDAQLAPLLEPVAPGALTAGQEVVAARAATLWATSRGRPPAIQLLDGDREACRAVAAAACTRASLGLYALSDRDLPTGLAELERTARLWEREAVLSGCALLLECDEGDDATRGHRLERLANDLAGPLLITGGPRRRLTGRPVLTMAVPAPRPDERRALWRAALGPAAACLNGELDQLTAQFELGPAAIAAACTAALAQGGPAAGGASDTGGLSAALWEASRAEARRQMDGLAQRIAPAACWDDLVLPVAQRSTLREIALQLRQRDRVYEAWGFGAAGARGRGISALFAGGSGTGKTMAAEVLAGELRLDLYRIDLSAVVSKYIGETEKNLRRVFDAAEASGAILLFDEADALFGKRSEVKDSHDRYANIEVSYLLQRMESYSGLAILTTNLKESLDQAFLRRIRFVVQFPFPDAEQRAAIWARVFPTATPTEGLDATRLARLSVAGGNIRNIALHAAFLAADEGAPVGMAHLLRAARGECAKLERPLAAAEVKDWV